MAQVTAKTRTGVIAKKLGMTRIFDETGAHIGVTAFKVDSNQVIRVTDLDKQGYLAVQVGAGERKASRTTKPQKGHFAKSKVEPKQVVHEFRIPAEGLLEVGAEISAAHFVPGQYVDVTSTTVGRGFAGVIKRWNFGGMPASHGVSVSHRAHGSTGGRQDPGRVFKNKKMAGHKGVKQRTQMNLKVVAIDEAHDVIFVKGSVPGSENAWVTIRDAVKKVTKQPKEIPFPAGLKKSAKAAEAAAPAVEAGQASEGEQA